MILLLVLQVLLGSTPPENDDSGSFKSLTCRVGNSRVANDLSWRVLVTSGLKREFMTPYDFLDILD